MATMSETTGDERAQRIAELKRKMQENAKRVKAEHKEEQSTADVPAVKAAPVATAEAPVTEGAVAVPVADGAAAVASPAATAAPVVAPATAAIPTAAAPSTAEEEEEEANNQAALTRREFLTYAWGAAMGLLAVEAGLVSYLFMYPRFRAGEFGGKFFLPTTDVPALESAPIAETAGKFWLVNSEDGPKALYMVCTHLGCLYKWEASNNRFECPCHGSKFSKDGFYIEGPAPRSLDEFDLAEENGQIVVDTGAKITGGPANESPARVIAT